MNSRAEHLEPGDLLRLIDGELGREDADAALGHIDSCWNCRTLFREFETVIGEYVRYQKNADQLLPPPPQPWRELSFDSAPAVDPPFMRLLPVRRWFDWRWAALAASVVLITCLIYRLQTPPTVNAAGLLRKAMATEPADGSIRIRMRSATLVRPATLKGGLSRDDAHVREMFERVHFDWSRPLSARAFAGWRDQLKDKRDEAELKNEGATGSAYIIRTSTTSSDLRRATLTLRVRDLQPVREMLEFSGETVEIEPSGEAAQQQTRSSVVEKSPASVAPPRTGEPSPESTLHRLLQVFSILHQLGADLGEAVEIRQREGHIDVTAVGLPASRQQQLRAELDAIPSVSVNVASGLSSIPARKETANVPPTESSPGQTALEGILGSTQAAEDFTDRALDASDTVLAHVHALRALAKAFPPAQEAAMADTDRQSLAALRQDHNTALIARIGDLRNVLKPVIPIDPAKTAGTDRANTWQSEAELLFLAAQQFDEILNRELAGNTVARSDFSSIAAAFARLDREAVMAAGH